MIKNTYKDIIDKLNMRNFTVNKIEYYNTYSDSLIECTCNCCGTVLKTTMKTLMKKEYHKCTNLLGIWIPCSCTIGTRYY